MLDLNNEKLPSYVIHSMDNSVYIVCDVSCVRDSHLLVETSWCTILTHTVVQVSTPTLSLSKHPRGNSL